jgi:hypothetical protein
MTRRREGMMGTPLRCLELVRGVRTAQAQVVRCQDASLSQRHVHEKKWRRRGGVDWGSDGVEASRVRVRERESEEGVVEEDACVQE